MRKLTHVLLVFSLTLAACFTAQGATAGMSGAATGYAHSLAVDADGNLWAWGRNSFGQLGDGTKVSQSAPKHILSNVSSVAAGYNHSLALKEDGSLWAWGQNTNGQVGDGTKIHKLLPVQVLDDVQSIAAGYHFSMAIKKDGSLWVWGANDTGQLGDGSKSEASEPLWPMPPRMSPKLSPVRATTIDNLSAVTAGAAHSLAIKNDGSLWASGWNYYYGQLGNNAATGGGNSSVPGYFPNSQFGNANQLNSTPQVIRNNGVAKVSANKSHSHTLAVMTDGSLWAWGDNTYGQLGDGSATKTSSPKKIIDSGIIEISAGFGYSMAIKSDGSLLAWGGNAYGRLGNGNNNDVSQPVNVLDNAKAVSAGINHSLAIKNDGSLWAWGCNSDGQLGNGTSGNSNPQPVQVGSTPVIIGYGDVNGDGKINATDATMLRRYIAAENKEMFCEDNPSFKPANADVNGNGLIDEHDVTLLRRYLSATNPNAIPLGPQSSNP